MSVQIGFIGGAYFDVEDDYADVSARLAARRAFETTLQDGRYGRIGDRMVLLVNPSALAYVLNQDPA